MEIVSEFCEKNNVFLIVDAISSFLADKISIVDYAIDMLITSSQKALALPPGLSFIVLNKKAVDKIDSKNPKTLYFDMKIYLKNGERGQTPFTPAVSVILQLNKRLTKEETNLDSCCEAVKIRFLDSSENYKTTFLLLSPILTI